jgi:conjugative transposon TraJ protein
MMLLSVDFSNLHTILETLYDDMLPLCEDMMDVGKGIAGLGALFYVAMRVWQSLAHAEPVDVYPLLRPFAIGICILLFPTLVLGTMNSVLGLVVQGTHRMLEGQTLDMEQYREQKEKLEYEIKMRNPETAYLVSDEEFDRQIDELGWGLEDTAAKIGMYAEWGAYQFEKIFRDGIRYLLELLFASASLLIDTVRTFFLIVLSILGPVAFAFSVWDGFHSTLSQWFMRYISVYLWLPVSDLFSCMLAGADAPEGHPGAPDQCGLLPGHIGQRVPDIHDHRHFRLLHDSHRCGMDRPGGRRGQLHAQPEPPERPCGRLCRRSGRFRRR